jgi:hypothetical protein
LTETYKPEERSRSITFSQLVRLSSPPLTTKTATDNPKNTPQLTYKKTQATQTQKLGFRGQKSKVPTSSAAMRA